MERTKAQEATAAAVEEVAGKLPQTSETDITEHLKKKGYSPKVAVAAIDHLVAKGVLEKFTGSDNENWYVHRDQIEPAKLSPTEIEAEITKMMGEQHAAESTIVPGGAGPEASLRRDVASRLQEGAALGEVPPPAEAVGGNQGGKNPAAGRTSVAGNELARRGLPTTMAEMQKAKAEAKRRERGISDAAKELTRLDLIGVKLHERAVDFATNAISEFSEDAAKKIGSEKYDDPSKIPGFDNVTSYAEREFPGLFPEQTNDAGEVERGAPKNQQKLFEMLKQGQKAEKARQANDRQRGRGYVRQEPCDPRGEGQCGKRSQKRWLRCIRRTRTYSRN